MDMRFGIWNIMGLYRAGSLMTVSMKISRYRLDLWECRRSDGRAVAPYQKRNTHFYGKRNEYHELVEGFCT
jgi:hypothetical protein